MINSAPLARRLLDELRSPNLKIVFDGANLLSAETLGKQHRVLQEAVDLLGPDVVLAHAKDLAGSRHVAAGRGEVDYGFYLMSLQKAGFKGPLILHGLGENEVEGAMAFLRSKLEELSTTTR